MQIQKAEMREQFGIFLNVLANLKSRSFGCMAGDIHDLIIKRSSDGVGRYMKQRSIGRPCNMLNFSFEFVPVWL